MLEFSADSKYIANFSSLSWRNINNSVVLPAYLGKELNSHKNFGKLLRLEIKAVFEDEEGCMEMYKSYGLKVYDCKPHHLELTKTKVVKQNRFRNFMNTKDE